MLSLSISYAILNPYYNYYYYIDVLGFLRRVVRVMCFSSHTGRVCAATSRGLFAPQHPRYTRHPTPGCPETHQQRRHPPENVAKNMITSVALLFLMGTAAAAVVAVVVVEWKAGDCRGLAGTSRPSECSCPSDAHGVVIQASASLLETQPASRLISVFHVVRGNAGFHGVVQHTGNPRKQNTLLHSRSFLFVFNVT